MFVFGFLGLVRLVSCLLFMDLVALMILRVLNLGWTYYEFGLIDCSCCFIRG